MISNAAGGVVCAAGPAALAFALLLTAPAAAHAQGSALAAVRGAASDTSGQPLRDVRVELRHEPTGRTASSLTDANGLYVLPNVAPGGPYTITATALGWVARPVARLQLDAGAVHRIDLVLVLTAVALPGIDVNAPAGSRFGQSRDGAATLLDRDAVAGKATLERNVMELAALSPMAAATADGFTIAGQNVRFNALRLDGAAYHDAFGVAADGVPGGRAAARPLPLQAVEQFQVLVAPFDVRLSGFGGGLLNIITRGGTNDWEAAAFGHHRPRSLVGALDVHGLPRNISDFRSSVAGFSIGGPLRRDRVHFFGAFELERRTAPSSGYSVGVADPLAMRIAPDSVFRFADILRDRFGMDAGETGELSLETGRDNAFARLDWRLGDGHRLLLRHNFAGARRDAEPNRAATDFYELGSLRRRFEASSHASTLQLVSALSARWSSELLVNVHATEDRVAGASADPVVEVHVRSAGSGSDMRRRVRAGGHPEAQSGRLSQRTFELRQSLSGGIGRHLLTAGAGAELLRFRSTQQFNTAGVYRFDSLAALEMNRPVSFERRLAPAAPATFSVAQFSGFVQDEWSPLDRLTVRAGLRVDVPSVRSRRADNLALLDALAINAAAVPRAAPLWSPRLALNWQSGATLTTQMRGGVGVFAGRPAFAWLGSAHDAAGAMLLTCPTARAPQLAAATRPVQCLGAAQPGDLRAAPIVVFASDFRFPQDLRVAGGFDQQLPFGIIVTGDVVYTRALTQIMLRDLNLADVVDSRTHVRGFTDGFGFPTRLAFGAPTVSGFAPGRRDAGFEQVIELGNDAQNRALAATLEVTGHARGVRYTGAYTYTRSLDVQSLVHLDAATNHGSTAGAGDPNRPAATLSDFDRPHKVLASVGGRVLRRGGGTDVSLLYIAESGAPFTFVYAADINGDGNPGSSALGTYNDPVYVPALLSEFPGSIVSAAALNSLERSEQCLQDWRGHVLGRNACRAPATHRMDLRVAQAVRIGGLELTTTADLLNVFHLLGSDRGKVWRVPPRVPVLDLLPTRIQTTTIDPTPQDPLAALYAGGTRRNEAGGVEALAPYSLDPAASRWQAQFGIQIRR